MNTNSNTSG
jgi:hypothetical protein